VKINLFSIKFDATICPNQTRIWNGEKIKCLMQLYNIKFFFVGKNKPFLHLVWLPNSETQARQQVDGECKIKKIEGVVLAVLSVSSS
jgi:hypothetical protein